MKKALSLFSVLSASLVVVSAQVINVNTNAVSSQGQVNVSALNNLLTAAQQIVDRLVPFAVGLAVVAFFWFLIVFITKGGQDPAKKTEALKHMGYSILALFAMVSIWGIIGLLGSMVGIGQGGSVPIPSVPSLRP